MNLSIKSVVLLGLVLAAALVPIAGIAHSPVATAMVDGTAPTEQKVSLDLQNAPIREALNRVVNEVLADPDSRRRLEGLGLDIIGGAPERVTALLEIELKRHAELVKFSGASID